MTRRHFMLGSIMMLAIVGAVAVGKQASRAGDADFVGFVVRQGTEEFKFPASDGWRLTSKGGLGYTLESRARTSFWGTFEVREISRASAAQTNPSASTASGWTVVQDGRRYEFKAADRWRISLTPEGLFAERPGEHALFYGTFRAEERK